MWWPFRPKHTVDSVLEALVEGIEQGRIVLDDSEPAGDSVGDNVVVRTEVGGGESMSRLNPRDIE